MPDEHVGVVQWQQQTQSMCNERNCTEIMQKQFTIKSGGKATQLGTLPNPAVCRQQVLAELTAPVRRGRVHLAIQEDVQRSFKSYAFPLLIRNLSLLLVRSLSSRKPIRTLPTLRMCAKPGSSA